MKKKAKGAKAAKKAKAEAKKKSAGHGHVHVYGRDESGHHAHGHAHDHDHDHDHDHEHEHEHVEREELERGVGKGKILFLDAPSGLAGDMVIAALVDLGVPESVIEEAVERLPVGGFHLHFGTRERSGIVATAFDVHVEDEQPERTWGGIRKLLAAAKLSPGVLARATATFERLAASEARVHRMPADEVHFHEVGSIDAIVDVVGSAAAIEYLGARVVVSPLPLGRGRVKARHGVLPLPAPAVVECLRGFPTYDGGIPFEFVTPTGAAIVAAHADPSEATAWPAMRPLLSGWGAGTADLADRANLLRVVLGEPTAEGKRRTRAGLGDATHVVLEANVDDMTGELLGHCVEALLEAGALDAWTSPLTMKKGRPGHILGALTEVDRADELSRVFLRESTSLGVRRTVVDRVERPRRLVPVKTRFGSIPVKLGGGPTEAGFGPLQRKPEFDAARAAAHKHGVPVREVLAAAVSASEALELEPEQHDHAKSGD